MLIFLIILKYWQKQKRSGSQSANVRSGILIMQIRIDVALKAEKIAIKLVFKGTCRIKRAKFFWTIISQFPLFSLNSPVIVTGYVDGEWQLTFCFQENHYISNVIDMYLCTSRKLKNNHRFAKQKKWRISFYLGSKWTDLGLELNF